MPTRPEKTTFFAGILNVFPSSGDLGEGLTSATVVSSGCIVTRDPLLKTRSPAGGIPAKITTTAASSYIDVPVNLYQTSNGDEWLGSLYVTTNTPAPTSMKVVLYITDYSGAILQTQETLIPVTNQWLKRTFNITNTTTDPPPPSTTDDGNPNQVRLKILNPVASGVQIWLDDLRLNRQETLISIYKSSTTLDGDHPLRDPYSNYENIYFDSRFDYFNIPGDIVYSSVPVTLGYRPKRSVRRRKKPGRTRKKRWVDVPISGYSKSLLLTHGLGKIPIVIAYEPGGAYFGGTTIIQKEESGGASSFRTAWISADSDKLYLNERWYTYKQPLSPISLNISCYVFNEPAKVITGGPTPPVYNAGEPLVVGTNTGSIFTSLNGQTDTWKGRMMGLEVVDGSDTYYINSLISLFHLNGLYYTYHLEPDTPATLSGTDYDTDYWEGWSSFNKALGWSPLDPTDANNAPLQQAILLPSSGNTTDCLGISINTNRPKKVDIFYSSDPNDDDPPFIGAGYVKALPYKIYSSNNKGETWTYRATLPSPALHTYGAGGAGIACSPTGTAVAVASMIGGEQVEKVNIVGNWQRFDNENFTPKTVSVVFSAPEIAGGVTATGEPIIDKFQNLVGISMTNRGSGYIDPPTVTIIDTDTTPVPGTVTVTAYNNRTVAAVYDADGNLVSPEQKFWKVSSATASGTSWLHKRTTTITFSNGATANLTFANGSVTAITITSQGSEVGPSASAPTITATLVDTDPGTEVLGTAVAVLTSGRGKKPTAAYSTDWGLTWAAATLPTISYGGLCDVVYASTGGFVAVGHNNLIMTSTNGSSWTDVSPSAFNKQVHWQKVIYAKSNYFCCGFNNGTSYIIKSSDGSSWAQVYSISGTYLHSIVNYLSDGKLIAAGGETEVTKPYFSGPSVVYPGEACWLKLTGVSPGTNVTIVGSNFASGYSLSAAADANGEVLMGNLTSNFSLGADDITQAYTYSVTIGFSPTVSHTVRFVKQVSNSVYTSPTSNASDYTNTTGYPIELTSNQYNVHTYGSQSATRGRTFITSDGNSWASVFNGTTPYVHHIISSDNYIP